MFKKLVALFIEITRVIIIIIFVVAILFLGFFLLLKFLEMGSVPFKVSRKSIIENTTYKPFFAGQTQFNLLNQEVRKISLVLITSFKTAESYFITVHDMAILSNWELVYTSPLKRIYLYPSNFPSEEYPEYLRSRATLLYNSKSNEVTILFENNYSEEPNIILILFVIICFLGLLILFLTKLKAKLE